MQECDVHSQFYCVEMFYLNTIKQLFLFVKQLDHLEVCLPYSRLLAGIPILAVFQNLRRNSNKTSLLYKFHGSEHEICTVLGNLIFFKIKESIFQLQISSSTELQLRVTV